MSSAASTLNLTATSTTTSVESADEEPEQNMYNEQEAQDYLLRAFNLDVWYYGEHSVLYSLISHECKVYYSESLGGISYIIIPNDDQNAIYVMDTNLDYTADVQLIETAFHYVTATETQYFIERIKELYGANGLPYKEITVEFPTPQKPIYGDRNSDNVQREAADIAEIVDNYFEDDDITVYIREFVSPNVDDFARCETVFFAQTDEKVYQFAYYADRQDFDDAPQYSVREVKSDREKYCFKQVKATTDWIIDMEEWAYEE